MGYAILSKTVEFTIESGLLYVLETRNSFRTAEAAAAIATSMVNEGILSEREALVRVDANHVQNYLHDSVDRVACNTFSRFYASKY